MKKLLLTLGTIATIIAPIVTVVSCGSDVNELSQEKEAMIKTLDGTTYELTAIEKADFIKRINTVTNSKDFRTIVRELETHITKPEATQADVDTNK